MPGSCGEVEAPAEPAAVFLDRDGVLNEPVVRDGRPHPPATPRGVQLLAGVLEACEALRQPVSSFVVVTNQPDIARGLADRAVVDEFHDVLLRALPIEAVYVCPHDDADGCACRKPGPGMLLEAARDSEPEPLDGASWSGTGGATWRPGTGRLSNGLHRPGVLGASAQKCPMPSSSDLGAGGRLDNVQISAWPRADRLTVSRPRQ